MSVNPNVKRDFEILFKTHYESLFARAFGWLQDEDEAHDVVSEAFARLWQQLANIKVEARLSFLHATLRNLSLDLLRRRSVCDRYAEWAIATASESEEEVGETERQLQIVERLVLSLPPLTRQIVTASYFQRQTHREVALELQVSESTVKYHLHKALCLLREGLTQENAIAL